MNDKNGTEKEFKVFTMEEPVDYVLSEPKFTEASADFMLTGPETPADFSSFEPLDPEAPENAVPFETDYPEAPENDVPFETDLPETSEQSELIEPEPEKTPEVPKVIEVSEEEIDQQMDLADLIALTAPKKEEPEEAPENPTMDYYNTNAESYCERTVSADMTSQYRFFLKYMPAGARILDLGCGSGRDTKYFRDNGYNVTAVDGSEEMCRKAEAYTGIPVRRMDFLDLADREIYTGIWASASLLHLPKKDLNRMFAKLRKALTKEGVLYVSFKEGNFEGIRDGRFYTDLTEGELFNLINTVGGMKIVEAKHFSEMRDEEEVHWLCAIIKKW